jgi:hypothetical protein
VPFFRNDSLPEQSRRKWPASSIISTAFFAMKNLRRSHPCRASPTSRRLFDEPPTTFLQDGQKIYINPHRGPDISTPTGARDPAFPPSPSHHLHHPPDLSLTAISLHFTALVAHPTHAAILCPLPSYAFTRFLCLASLSRYHLQP